MTSVEERAKKKKKEEEEERKKNRGNSSQQGVKQEMCHVPLGSTPDLEMLHT